jgi:hypothetical protein
MCQCVSGPVDRVEDVAGEHHHVAEHGADQAHRDDVHELRAVGEPLRLGQRPEQGHPDSDAEPEEGRMLRRVEQVVAERGLVERRDVPDVEVHRPAGDRQHGMCEHSQPADRAHAQQRRQQRAGAAEDDQQRRHVPDHQVFEHVHEQQLVGELVDGRAEGHCEHDQAACEAGLPPTRHRPPDRRQRARTDVVRVPEQQDHDREPDRGWRDGWSQHALNGATQLVSGALQAAAGRPQGMDAKPHLSGISAVSRHTPDSDPAGHGRLRPRASQPSAVGSKNGGR